MLKFILRMPLIIAALKGLEELGVEEILSRVLIVAVLIVLYDLGELTNNKKENE